MENPQIINLDENQKKAVEKIEGPLLVYAGAGAGKTRVIVERIINMLKKGINPENILAVTFTNKAAKEMKDRIKLSTENDIDKLTIGTFHSVFLKILRENGNTKTVIDDDDIKSILKKITIKFTEYTTKDIKNIVNKFENNAWEPDDENIRANQNERDIYKEYVQTINGQRVMGFGTILVETLKLLKNNPGLSEKYAKKFKYILVDEYQDTNEIQKLILNQIARHHNNICVVGDDDQCIYEFRGSKIENILGFEKEYPNVTKIILENNYRSEKSIINKTQKLIKNNIKREPKDIKAVKKTLGTVEIIKTSNKTEEAKTVCNIIMQSEGKIGILYKYNYIAQQFEPELIKNKIPYTIYGQHEFFQKKVVKDILSFIKFTVNPLSEADKMRSGLLMPGIGKKTIQKEIEPMLISTKQTPIEKYYDLINAISESIKTKDYEFMIDIIINNIHIPDEELKTAYTEAGNEIKNIIMSYEDIKDFLDNAILINEKKETDTKVSLLTIHKAKGLEFDTVILVSADDKTFPAKTQSISPSEEENNRRLIYVAMTRAIKQLYVTYPLFNGYAYTRPSKLLEEIY